MAAQIPHFGFKVVSCCQQKSIPREIVEIFVVGQIGDSPRQGINDYIQLYKPRLLRQERGFLFDRQNTNFSGHIQISFFRRHSDLL